MFGDKLKKVINSNDHESNGGNDKKKIENLDDIKSYGKLKS